MNGRSASPDVDDRTELRVDRQRSSSISNDVIASSPSQHPQHRGPQPISPPPPSPQISAADLLLLTEASATHNGTFQCTLCSKQFGYKNGLIRHVRLTHVGEKPYQCSICNRRFGYKHILMEHQNLHFGNRPYACHLCDKRLVSTIRHSVYHCGGKKIALFYFAITLSVLIIFVYVYFDKFPVIRVFHSLCKPENTKEKTF